MHKMLFDDLVQSMKEAQAIAKGEAKAWRGSGFVIPPQTLCTQARVLPSHKTIRTGLQIPSGGAKDGKLFAGENYIVNLKFHIPVTGGKQP